MAYEQIIPDHWFVIVNPASGSGYGLKDYPRIAKLLRDNQIYHDAVLAICSGDNKAIAKAPGIGAKTAARIILELRDKMAAEFTLTDVQDFSATVKANSPVNKNLSEAAEALMVLGYDKNTVMNALQGIDTAKTDVGEIIRLALKKLAR